MKLQSFSESSTPLSMTILNEAVRKTFLLNLLFWPAQWLSWPGKIPGRNMNLSFLTF